LADINDILNNPARGHSNASIESEVKLKDILLTRMPKLLNVGLLLAIISNYYFLNSRSVNIPVGDEWEALNSSDNLSHFNWSWITRQHNEHRIIFTKLQTYLLYQYNRWDITTQIIQNFAIYLLAVIFIWIAVYKGRLRSWSVIAGASIFLFSASIKENFTWGFQSQFHFVILFSVLSVILITYKILTWAKILMATLFTIAAIYSFSSGLPMAISLIAVFLLQSAFLYVNSRKSVDVLYKCGFFTISVLSAIGLYFLADYHQVSGHPKLVLPYEYKFWEFLAHLVGAGFSVPHKSLLGGTICLLLVIQPIAILMWRDFRSRSVVLENWTLFMLYGLFFAALGSISLGRAGFGFGQAYSSRYVEFSAPLILLSAVAWHRLYPTSVKVRRFLVVGFLLLLGFHRKQFAFDKIYSDIGKSRMRGVECLKDSIRRGDIEIICTDLYPWDLRAKIEQMKMVDVSFGDGIVKIKQ
jgi:hypothetical protein